MQIALRWFLEMVLGYLLQASAIVLGMHGVSRQKVDLKACALVSLISSAATYLIRSSGLFNFGVHTMLTLLVVNGACIALCRLHIRTSILGSILMMIFVLLSELINVGLLALTAGYDQISALLADPLTKAASAVPGNIVLFLTALLIYRFRTRGGMKDESCQ